MNKLLADFRSQGFILIKGLFSTNELYAVKRNILEIFHLGGCPIPESSFDHPDLTNLDSTLINFFETYPKKFIGCASQIQNLAESYRICFSSKMLQILQDLGLKYPHISTRPVLSFHSRHLAVNGNEKYWKTPAHQDWRSIQGSLNSVVAWIPLVNIRDDMGPLEVISGSHRLGLLETEKDVWYRKILDPRLDESNFQKVAVHLGDALLFSTFLVHRSGTNTSNSIRCSLQFRYNDLSEKTFIERNFPNPYIYEPIQELITPEFPKTDLINQYFDPTNLKI